MNTALDHSTGLVLLVNMALCYSTTVLQYACTICEYSLKSQYQVCTTLNMASDHSTTTIIIIIIINMKLYTKYI